MLSYIYKAYVTQFHALIQTLSILHPTRTKLFLKGKIQNGTKHDLPSTLTDIFSDFFAIN